ncbi:26S proteasome complex subunit SEM1 [Haemorhous mexicanus]|uniref:26S proteasome complex subunit SEM1 n=1 Tax=Haemorhous mexicanus TaxID=30427 RepID=UPI0028BF06C1|nr:26S proteasome complex subunit SEM1 [Haemorhous mexicanus]
MRRAQARAGAGPGSGAGAAVAAGSQQARCGGARCGPSMSEKKQPVDLGLLEEDDEFEEFPAEDWTGLDEDEDAHVWEDNWDDDNVEDDFSNQLRAELEKHGYKMETS